MHNLYNKNVFRKVLKGEHVVATYPKATTGAQTLAAAHATLDRNVMILVEVIEAFAQGSGGQPTFTVGETSTLTKFTLAALLTGAIVGNRFVIFGRLAATKALIVTAVAATGTGTGAIRVSVGIMPITI